MIFNSLVFVLFFVVVLACYWGLQRAGLRAQNLFLLAASYVFYGAWDVVFLGLIILSTLQKFLLTIWMDRQTDQRYRRALLVLVVGINVALLGLFKYYNFFSGELLTFLVRLGLLSPSSSSAWIIRDLILPVGISFYTFQATAYSVDVYRRRIPPVKDLFLFALFDCYFPQLVAGPIERAEDLIPRLGARRTLDWQMAAKSAWDILLGFFLKVVVADSLGSVVDGMYGTKEQYLANPAMSGSFGLAQLLLTNFAYLLQIYGDFAGYSLIALGTSGLLGIPLTRNFLQPLLSPSIGEFWRRWHTTLMRWFTDYIYIPLGGSRVSKGHMAANLMVVFLVSGLWHGANWTFVFWGALNGAYIIVYRLFIMRREPQTVPRWKRIGGWLVTLLLIVSGMTFFRAHDLHQVMLLHQGALMGFDRNILGQKAFEIAALVGMLLTYALPVFLIDGATVYFKSDYWVLERRPIVRLALYLYLYLSVVLLGQFGKEVIYFAF